MLAYGHASRLLNDPKARARAERAFETRMQSARGALRTTSHTGARRR